MKSLRGWFRRKEGVFARNEAKNVDGKWEVVEVRVRRDSLEAQYLMDLPSADEQWESWGYEPIEVMMASRLNEGDWRKNFHDNRIRRALEAINNVIDENQKAEAFHAH